MSLFALQPNLATKQACQLPADRESKTSSTITTAGTSIGLKEWLEYRGLFIRRNSNATVRDGKREDCFCVLQMRVVLAPARLGTSHPQCDIASLRKFERVREQIFHHLVQTLRVRANRIGNAGIDLDIEFDSFSIRHMTESALHVLPHFLEPHFRDIDRDGAGFDL